MLTKASLVSFLSLIQLQNFMITKRFLLHVIFICLTLRVRRQSVIGCHLGKVLLISM